MRSLYHYTMCRHTTEPVARTVGVCSEPRLLERHRPAGGTAAPAGVPLGQAFRRPELVVSESLERAGRILREDSRKGSLLRRPCFGSGACAVGLSAWPLLTPPLKLAPAPLRRVSDCSTTGAPPVLRPGWVRQEGSYLVDPASSHMLVSKIKPCMSKYKLLYTVKLRMAH